MGQSEKSRLNNLKTTLLDILHKKKCYKNVLVLIILMNRKNVSYLQDLKAYDSENAVYLENMLHMPTHMLSFIKKSKGIIIQLKK